MARPRIVPEKQTTLLFQSWALSRKLQMEIVEDEIEWINFRKRKTGSAESSAARDLGREEENNMVRQTFLLVFESDRVVKDRAFSRGHKVVQSRTKGCRLFLLDLESLGDKPKS